MRATLFFRESPLLGEMRQNDLFVPHFAGLQECVCARISDIDTQWDAKLTNEEVVVIACRVTPQEPGYQRPGFVDVLPMDTWVTPVDQVGVPYFRERMPLDEIPAVMPEAVVPECVKRFVDPTATASSTEKGRAEAALHRGERHIDPSAFGNGITVPGATHLVCDRRALADLIASLVIDTVGGENAVRIPINPHPSPAG